MTSRNIKAVDVANAHWKGMDIASMSRNGGASQNRTESRLSRAVGVAESWRRITEITAHRKTLS